MAVSGWSRSVQKAGAMRLQLRKNAPYHAAFTLLRRPARDSMAPARASLRAHSQTSFAEDDAAPDDDAGPNDERDA